MKVGIIGNGWVGQAMLELFPNAYMYLRRDISELERKKFDEGVNYVNDKDKINECDVAFICVPTPVIHSTSQDPSAEEIAMEDRLDTSIVEEIIGWLKTPLIVIRSTVNPGDTYRWRMRYKKSIVFQPEYLGETPNHPLIDTQNTPFLIIGGEQPDRRKLIELYTTVYNANVKIRQIDDFTAEVIKLTENRAIAFKVAQCQELYDACEAAKVDYYTVRDAVFGDDPRMDLWWTMIYPEKRGFNSKCIPKDVYAWCAFAENAGVKPDITRAILEKNKEWIK